LVWRALAHDDIRSTLLHLDPVADCQLLFPLPSRSLRCVF